ncbi:MAG: hypothetical protein ACREB0_07925 [Sphingopyxis sp.]
MPPVELETALDELYVAPREEFVSRRKDLAETFREAGQAAAAARVDKLAKPTTAAWLANRLARTAAADVRTLAKLGDSLRTAHARLDGDEIRSLTKRRSELVRTLLHRIEASSGPALSETVIAELEDIFTRAIADEEVAAALMAGRLTSAKAFAPMTGWPSVTVGESTQKTATRSLAKTVRPANTRTARLRRERARKALVEARVAVKSAEATRSTSERALTKAESAAEEAAARVRQLAESLAATQKQEDEARDRVVQAHRSVKEADRKAAAAWRSVQAAEAKLRAEVEH